METIEGTDCFLFEIIPSEEAVLEAMFDQLQLDPFMGEEVDALSSLLFGLVGKAMDFSMYIWI